MFKYIISVLFIFPFAFAQLPESFSYVTQNEHFGQAFGVTVSPDSTIFLANYYGGLRAYKFENGKFINAGYINDGGPAIDLDIGLNGDIFLANGYDGIRAYRHNESGFINTAHINEGYSYCVYVANDSVIFAGGGPNLYVYKYNGSSFMKEAVLETNSVLHSVVAVHDSIIIIANGAEGISAYKYKDSKFTKLSQIDDGGLAFKVVARNDTLYLANYGDGLRVYIYDDSLKNIAHLPLQFVEDVDVIDSKNIFIAVTTGLYALSLTDTSLIIQDSLNFNEHVKGVSLGSNNIYVAVNNHGLQSIEYRNQKLTKIASINDGGWAENISFDRDGNIYVANGSGGIRVYKFNNSILGNVASFYNEQIAYAIKVGMDKYIYAVNWTGLDVFEWQNNKLILTTSKNDSTGGSDIGFLSNGTIITAEGDNGLRAFNYSNSILTEIGHIKTGLFAHKLVIDNDDNIILDNGVLQIYNFDGLNFNLVANDSKGSIEDINILPNQTIIATKQYSDGRHPTYSRLVAYKSVNDLSEFTYIEDGNFELEYICVSPDGIIFTAGEYGGIRAYKLDRNEFHLLANYNDNIRPTNISMSPDGNIFVANSNGSMKVFSYSGYKSGIINPPKRITLHSNYPNPFNSETTIVYELSNPAKVDLEIYNILGQIVKKTSFAYKSEGFHRISLNACNLNSGIYFYRIKGDNIYSTTQKMVIIK